jgi:hypothetical protein
VKIPNCDFAVVSEEKIFKYILNEDHPDGTHKAKFFIKFGFSLRHWGILTESLIDHCKENEVVLTTENEFGTKYIVEGELKTPDNRNPVIRTIWFIEKNDNKPRLITAYPKKP